MASHEHEHDHGSELSEMSLRVRALETILTEKGYVDPAALDPDRRNLRNEDRPAKRDPGHCESLERYRVQTRADRGRDGGGGGSSAEGGRRRSSGGGREHAKAAQHGRRTLCSCYPIDLLGTPPVWYKSAPYRSRAVRDPRGVLADFGVILPADTEIRVWDSTAETRYLVLPMRPDGTEGWDEERLASLVTAIR